MSYTNSDDAIQAKIDEDLWQSVIPQLSVKDLVSSPPSNPDPGDTYIIDRSSSETSKNQKSFRFNSNEPDRITIPSDSPWNNWDGLTSFTIELVFASTETAHDHVLFSTRNQPGEQKRVEGRVLANGNIKFTVEDASNRVHTVVVSSDVDVLDGAGHRLTFRRDGTNYGSSDAMDIFVDGSSTTTVSETIDDVITSVSDGQFTIGQPYDPRGGSQTFLDLTSDNEYVTIPDSNSLDFTEDFTIHFVMDPDSIGSGSFVVKSGSYRFYPENATKWTFEVTATNQTVSTTWDFDSLPAGEIAVGVVRAADRVAIIVDGDVKARNRGQMNNTATSANDIIMADQQVNTTLDEIYFWSEARLHELTVDPYRQYNGTETNLEAAFSCNDDSSLTVIDSTSNGNDGTITNGSYVTESRPQFDSTVRPGGDVRDFRIFDEAIATSLVVSRAKQTITGREDNMAGYWPMTYKSQGQTLDFESDGGATFNNRANHGAIKGPEVVEDGILLQSPTPSVFNQDESFESGGSPPFVIDDDGLEVFVQGDTDDAAELNGTAIDGDYVIGQEKDFQSDTTGRFGFTGPMDEFSLISGERIDEFSFNFFEDSFQHGGGIRLINTEGTYEVGMATDNPAWILDDGTGDSEQIYSGDGTGRWVFVRFRFDWENGQYDYYIEDKSSGTVRQGTRDLVSGKNIAAAEIWTWSTQGSKDGWTQGPTQIFQMSFDQIKFKKNSESFDGHNNEIAIYNGTSWRFYPPTHIKNPRAYVQSLDRIYRYQNGSWGEIIASGHIQRIESGNLPSSPVDGGAVIDARYGDVEWLRVYNASNDTWELEGVGVDVNDVDMTAQDFQDGTLESGLTTIGGKVDALEIDVTNNSDPNQITIENRTSDPSSPDNGRIWLRTDL